MGANIISLLVLIVVGVIIANMIAPSNVKGTKALFCNMANIWGIGVSGMLGQEYKPKSC